MPTLLLNQAAALLGISPVTLRKRAAAGIVPAYKPGRAWVFLEEELLAYLKSTGPRRSLVREIRTAWPAAGGAESGALARRIAARRGKLKRAKTKTGKVAD